MPWTMNDRIIRECLSSLILLSVLSCEPNEQVSMRAFLADAMNADSTMVTLSTWESGIVDGLVYHRGTVFDPQRPDGHWSLTSADLRGRYRIIDDAEAWVALIQDELGEVNSAGMAIEVCEEFARTAGRGRFESQGPVVYRGRETFNDLIYPEETEFNPGELHSPEADPGEDGWWVTLWVFEPGQATEYRCQVGSELVLTVKDSLPGKGLLDINP